MFPHIWTICFKLSEKPIINSFQLSDAFHTETCHLFCRAKQMTGFYMKHNTGAEMAKNITKSKYQLAIPHTVDLAIT